MAPPVDTTAPLVFLKLGGALLTQKEHRERLRSASLPGILDQVAEHWRSAPGRLVLAHGSGSFGHFAVHETDFARRPDDPLAFARVAAAARRLSVAIVDLLLEREVPALMVPGGLIAGRDEAGAAIDLRPDLVAGLLARGLLPVTYGDAAPRRPTGGGIVSTEPLLAALARAFLPRRLILATDVDGVFAARSPGAQTAGDGPIPRLDAALAARLIESGALGGSRAGAVDVTGGMASKVRLMLELARELPGLEVRVVSGLRPGALAAALGGAEEAGGTVIVGSSSGEI